MSERGSVPVPPSRADSSAAQGPPAGSDPMPPADSSAAAGSSPAEEHSSAGLFSREDAPIEMGASPFSLTGPEQAKPADEDEAPAPRSRRRAIVLSSLLAVGLIGAAALGFAGWGIASQKDATLSTPDSVAGLTIIDSEDARSTADYLKTALSAEVDLDHAVAGVYSDQTGSVLFFGGTTLFWTPEDDLDTAFDLISDDEGAVTGLHKVPAGPLGGTMKCGTTTTDEGDLSVCGWADHGSLALAMFPDRSEADSATLLRTMRTEIQQRS